jgi:hypothetical protein
VLGAVTGVPRQRSETTIRRVTKILHGRQKGFSGKGRELEVCWGSVEPVGPGPGQPMCSVMVTSRPLRLEV